MRIKIDSTKAEGATMSMVVSEVAPGANIPIHFHRQEDELIFIHTGSGLVTLGDRQVPSSTGAVLYAPRGVWHGIENTGSATLTWTRPMTNTDGLSAHEPRGLQGVLGHRERCLPGPARHQQRGSHDLGRQQSRAGPLVFRRERAEREPAPRAKSRTKRASSSRRRAAPARRRAAPRRSACAADPGCRRACLRSTGRNCRDRARCARIA